MQVVQVCVTVVWDLAPSNKVEGKKVKENLLDNNSNELIFTGNLITDLL